MKKTIYLICALILISGALIPAVHAVIPIDPAAPSSLTVQYSYAGKVYPGLEIKTYRIASVAPDGSIDLTGDFAAYPVNIHGITSQGEWNDVASTLAAYINADKLTPTAAGVTNASGTVTFSGILPGMYLTLAVAVEDPELIVFFENFLTMVPTPDENGAHDYNVAAYPKCETFPPNPPEEEIMYKVIVLWRDEGFEHKRPGSVNVELIRNGVIDDIRVLSPAEDWTYSWITPNDGAVWSVLENPVPDGYTVTYTSRERAVLVKTFIIINAYTESPTPDDPDAPPTGDTLSLWHIALPMCLAGGVILILAAWRRRYEDA